jgi:hypothetical protein
MGLQKAQKAKKDKEAREYIDLEKAEDHRKAGNEFF